MSNVTEFPKTKVLHDEKYSELLEENRELRKKIEALQNAADDKKDEQKRLEKIKKRLAKKSERMAYRAEIMRDVDTIQDYRALSQKQNYAELFGMIKSVRWQLHAVTTAFNLSVTERRNDRGVSAGFRSFSTKPAFLTILRISLNKHSNSEQIMTGSLIKTADRYGIGKTVVKNFLAEAVRENILTQQKKGVYDLSKQTKEDYWFNLLRTIYRKETIQLVGMLR